MKNRLSSLHLAKLVRIAIGSGLAIVVADLLSLQYSASAGIITLLTIQNTKKETIDIAMKRFLSFGLALLISYPLFHVFGYHPFVFGLFLLIFVGFSEALSLQDGISMNAVLTTHFLIEKTMSISFVLNELMILIIGMSVGVGLNLMIRQQTSDVKKIIGDIDDEMRFILYQFARFLRQEASLPIQINTIRNKFERITRKILEYQNNALRSDLTYYISYCSMRLHQLNVLEGMFEIMKQIEEMPIQAKAISEYLDEIAKSYHEQNLVIDLFARFDTLYQSYQNSELPMTRSEFEERAKLFQVLIMSKQFLLLKRQFVESLSKEQIEMYWYESEI